MSGPAAITGGLLLPPNDPRATEWARRLSLPNPKYIAWLRHQKGKEPAKTLSPVSVQDAGPWKGGAIVPRCAERAAGADRMVAPAGDALSFLGTLRPYQSAVVDAATERGSGVIVAPTGAGKTCIGCALMSAHDTPALVLVHSRDLADQWVERVRQFLGVEAGIVGYGKRKNGEPGDEARVVVASLQTLARWGWFETHEWGQRFGLVIQDEAHHAPANTYLNVLYGLAGRFRYGLTATPERADGLTPWMSWSLGPVVAEVDHRELEAVGAVLKPQIRWWQAPAVDLDDMEPHERAAKLADDDGRNGGLIFEARILVEQGRVVLMLVKLVDHAHQLAEGLQVAGVRASALVGDVKPKERAAILDRMRAGEVDEVVATSLADEGLDAPRVDTIIMTEPSRNVGRVRQRIGRALRPHVDGRQPLVVDVVDSHGGYRGAAKVREREYRRLGWLQ